MSKKIPAGLADWLVRAAPPAAAEEVALVPGDGAEMDGEGDGGLAGDDREPEQEAKAQAAKENEPPAGRRQPRKRSRGASPRAAHKAKRAKKASAEGET